MWKIIRVNTKQTTDYFVAEKRELEEIGETLKKDGKKREIDKEKLNA